MDFLTHLSSLYSSLSHPVAPSTYSEKAQIYLISFLAIPIAIASYRLYKIWSSQVDLPYVGIDGKWTIRKYLSARRRRITDRWGLQSEGYEKYTAKGLMFKLPELRRNHIYLPTSVIEEIKNLPETDVSFAAWTNDFISSRYTGIFVEDNSTHLRLLRGDLVQRLPKYFDSLSQECEVALMGAFIMDGVKEREWTAVPGVAKSVQIIAQMAARIFVGEKLCRDPRWLKESAGYTLAVFQLANRLKPWNPIVKYLFGWLTKEAKVIKKMREDAVAVVKPEIERRRAEKKAFEEEGKVWEEPEDMLQWLEERANEDEKSAETMADIQLTITLAATHTTSMALTNAVFDLIAYPEWEEELREELREALKRHGGKWSRELMGELVKLDAFMKESQRMNAGVVETFNRIVTNPKGLTLSTGTYLPPGAHLSAMTQPIFFNPQIHSSPETFNPHRFLSIPLNPSHSFTSASINHLSFGYGRHACPGRFFAAAEIKNVLVRLLGRYEMAFTKEGGRGQALRPKNLFMHTGQSPDFTALVYLRLRPVGERLF